MLSMCLSCCHISSLIDLSAYLTPHLWCQPLHPSHAHSLQLFLIPTCLPPEYDDLSVSFTAFNCFVVLVDLYFDV